MASIPLFFYEARSSAGPRRSDWDSQNTGAWPGPEATPSDQTRLKRLQTNQPTKAKANPSQPTNQQPNRPTNKQLYTQGQEGQQLRYPLLSTSPSRPSVTTGWASLSQADVKKQEAPPAARQGGWKFHETFWKQVTKDFVYKISTKTFSFRKSPLKHSLLRFLPSTDHVQLSLASTNTRRSRPTKAAAGPARLSLGCFALEKNGKHVEKPGPPQRCFIKWRSFLKHLLKPSKRHSLWGVLV